MCLKTKYNLFGSIFVAAAVLLDQYTKFAATSLKTDGALQLLPGIFHLQYLENRGAAFGIFQNRQYFFVLIAVVILIATIIYYRKFPFEKRFLPIRGCILCIAAGAVGNMIDRIRLGYVIDFFYFVPIDFPIFNVADIYVTVSVFVLILLILFYYKDEDLQYFSLS